MPAPAKRRLAHHLRAPMRYAATIACIVCPSLTASAAEQTGALSLRSFSITFVEVQTEASETPRIMRQRNAVRLTLRPSGQFDFERERNTGSISKAYLYRMATGAAGVWLEASHGSRIRVMAAPRQIVIEQHGSNFTQRFAITITGNTCKAAIAYAADPSPEQPPIFKMTEIVTKKSLRLATLAASEIMCSVGGIAMY